MKVEAPASPPLVLTRLSGRERSPVTSGSRIGTSGARHVRGASQALRQELKRACGLKVQAERMLAELPMGMLNSC